MEPQNANRSWSAGMNQLPVTSEPEASLLESIYVAYAAEARRVALAYLGEPEQAADAVHSAFVEVLRHLRTGRRWYEPEEARAVVLRNTRWAALKMLRTRRRRPETWLAEDLETADTTAWVRSESRVLCEQIVSRLAPRHRAALRLRFVDGDSNPQAAAHLGVSLRAFESQLRRGLAAARRAAQSLGILSGVVQGWYRRRTAARQALRAVRFSWSAATMAMIAVVGTATLQWAGAWSGSRTGDAEGQLSAVHLPTGAAAAAGVPALDEDPQDVVVVDAVAVESAAHPVTVLVLGQGRRCGCWVVLRSPDAGRHWTAAPGPHLPWSAAARLAVPSAYPIDPRIEVENGPGGQRLLSPAFGDDFSLASDATTVHDGSRHAVPCSSPTRAVACVGDRTVVTPGAGAVLAAADHLLYFPAKGGVLCAADGGGHWRTSCAARS